MQRYAAEFFGTYALVLAGCGAVMVDSLADGALGAVGIGAVFGLVIMVMVFAVGHVSGAHFNPAVSLSLTLTGNLPWRHLLPYWAVQLLAATLAALTLLLVLGNVADVGATKPSGSPAQSFFLEILLTFFLLFVIMGAAVDKRAHASLAGVAIGGTIALEAIFGGPISGASMNPARSFGPAIASGELTHLWIYIAAPAIGGVLGALSYHYLVLSPRAHSDEEVAERIQEDP